MFLRLAASSSTPKFLRALSAAFLLSLYVGGNTQVGFIHELLHTEEATNHSDIQEQNPCHRSIYHGEASGCKHQYHLVKVNTCSFCHMLTPIDEVMFSSTDKDHKYYSARTGTTVHSFLSDSEIELFLSRAPPLAHPL
jgi:hypothetical protein